MRRFHIAPRPDWKKQVEALGFDYHTDPDGYPYWNESNFYVLNEEMVITFSFSPSKYQTLSQLMLLESGINELHRICIALVERVVQSDELLQKLQIPAPLWPVVKKSWYVVVYGILKHSF